MKRLASHACFEQCWNLAADPNTRLTYCTQIAASDDEVCVLGSCCALPLIAIPVTDALGTVTINPFPRSLLVPTLEGQSEPFLASARMSDDASWSLPFARPHSAKRSESACSTRSWDALAGFRSSGPPALHLGAFSLYADTPAYTRTGSVRLSMTPLVASWKLPQMQILAKGTAVVEFGCDLPTKPFPASRFCFFGP